MATIAQTQARRFYKTAQAAETAGGFIVELDGKTLKTPAGQTLLLPTLALAKAIAGEWDAQGEHLALDGLRLTRLANSVVDGVIGREADVRADIAQYGASDLTCYRAPAPFELAQRQAAAWDPVLAWATDTHGIALLVTEGVTFCEQPEGSLARLRSRLDRLDAFALGSLSVMTSLLGSAVLALAHAEGRLNTASAWASAHVDEEWQSSQWGEDYEARRRRERRFEEFDAASRFYRLSGTA